MTLFSDDPTWIQITHAARLTAIPDFVSFHIPGFGREILANVEGVCGTGTIQYGADPVPIPQITIVRSTKTADAYSTALR